MHDNVNKWRYVTFKARHVQSAIYGLTWICSTPLIIIKNRRFLLSVSLFLSLDNAKLFAQLIARTAKDIDELVNSLPSDESSPELQVKGYDDMHGFCLFINSETIVIYLWVVWALRSRLIIVVSSLVALWCKAAMVLLLSI